MSHYIQQLKAETEAARHRQATEAEVNRLAEASASRDRLVPLDVRLGRLLATIPSEVQHDGLSLLSLVTLLKGRRGGTCHTGELGRALRRMGWTRVRCWRGGEDGGFAALWHPPKAI